MTKSELELHMEPIIIALQKRDKKMLRQQLEKLQPYDWGQIFFQLNTVFRRYFIELLSFEDIGELLKELEPAEQQEVLQVLGPDKTVLVLNQMPSDDVADLLGELEETHVQSLLKDMERVEADKVRALLHYPEDTAGGKMTSEFVTIYDHFSVEEVIQYLRREAPNCRNGLLCLCCRCR